MGKELKNEQKKVIVGITLNQLSDLQSGVVSPVVCEEIENAIEGDGFYEIKIKDSNKIL